MFQKPLDTLCEWKAGRLEGLYSILPFLQIGGEVEQSEILNIGENNDEL